MLSCLVNAGFFQGFILGFTLFLSYLSYLPSRRCFLLNCYLYRQYCFDTDTINCCLNILDKLRKRICRADGPIWPAKICFFEDLHQKSAFLLDVYCLRITIPISYFPFIIIFWNFLSIWRSFPLTFDLSNLNSRVKRDPELWDFSFSFSLRFPSLSFFSYNSVVYNWSTLYVVLYGVNQNRKIRSFMQKRKWFLFKITVGLTRRKSQMVFWVFPMYVCLAVILSAPVYWIF